VRNLSRFALFLFLAAVLSMACPALWAQDEAWEPPSAPANDEEANTSMYYAMQNGEIKNLEFYIKSNPKAVTLKNNELIQGAVGSNYDTAIVKMLIAAGADVNAKEANTQNTLLHTALAQVRDGKDSPDTQAANDKLLATIKLLISSGIKANEARPNDGFTPLLLAASSESIGKAFFDALFEAKDIDVNAKSNAGANTMENYTPLFYVITRNHIEGNTNKEIVDLLLAKGADIKHLTGKSQSAGRPEKKNALHLACETRGDRADIVEALLAKGMDIEAMDDENFSPLHLAAMANNAKITKLLLEKGANIASKNKDGVTVLDHCKGAGKDKHLESADIVINWKK